MSAPPFILLKESIPADELHELPVKHFEGEIVLVETCKMAKSAANYLHRFNILGFDTETKPSFRKGDNHQVSLLQLSTNEKAFLFRFRETGLPLEITDLLTDPGIVKPGVAIRDDLKALQKIRRFTPAGFLELQVLAKELGIKDFSLNKLCAIILGFRISKAQQLSNWESDQLTARQMIYAATDAWVSLKIFEKLQQITGR